MRNISILAAFDERNRRYFLRVFSSAANQNWIGLDDWAIIRYVSVKGEDAMK